MSVNSNGIKLPRAVVSHGFFERTSGIAHMRPRCPCVGEPLKHRSQGPILTGIICLPCWTWKNGFDGGFKILIW